MNELVRTCCGPRATEGKGPGIRERKEGGWKRRRLG